MNLTDSNTVTGQRGPVGSLREAVIGAWQIVSCVETDVETGDIGAPRKTMSRRALPHLRRQHKGACRRRRGRLEGGYNLPLDYVWTSPREQNK